MGRRGMGVVLAAVVLGIGVTIAVEKLKASALVKVYIGGNGEKITVVFLDPLKQKKVLIKFEGVGGDWEGKTLLHRFNARPRAEDYITPVKSVDYVSLVGRERQEGMVYEVYPKGVERDGIRVTYSAEESSRALGAKIVFEFNLPSAP